MAGRAELDLRAAAVNVDATSVNYANDSKLEQAVIFAEQAMTAKAGTATTKKPAITSVAAISGGANV